MRERAPGDVRTYFVTWDGHLPPRVPRDQVTYGATEGWPGYCVLTRLHDRTRLLERVVIERRPIRTIPFWESRAPGSKIYLRPHDDGEIVCVAAREISYDDTEALTRWGFAVVTSATDRVDFYHVERKVLFTDTYAYRPDGSIESVTVTWSDGRVETHRPTSHKPPMPLP